MRKITTKFISEDFYILCSDVLIYCKPVKEQYQYKGCIELNTAWIRELVDSEFVQNVFQIITPNKSYTLFLEEAEEKQDWITLLNKAIDTLVKKDPSLLEKRGEIKMRRTHSSFDSVLRKFFSFSPENFDHEFVDEFVMLDEDTGSHYIKVDLSKSIEGSDEVKEEKKEEEVAEKKENDQVEQVYNEYSYWNDMSKSMSESDKEIEVKREEKEEQENDHKFNEFQYWRL